MTVKPVRKIFSRFAYRADNKKIVMRKQYWILFQSRPYNYWLLIFMPCTNGFIEKPQLLNIPSSQNENTFA